MSDFDPRFPPTSNSLNRLKLEATILPDHVRGKVGYELLSTQALHDLIQPHTDEVAVFFEQVTLETEWAVDIANTLGTNLGFLLLTLLQQDDRTYEANPDKPAGFWSHWTDIRKVYLGGGPIRGKVGEIITTKAQATLQELADDPTYRVIQVRHPQHLPVLGAARMVQSGNRACVLDFGGSYIKRAIAHYSATTLRRLQIRDSFPHDLQDDDALRIFEQMVDIIVDSYSNADALLIPISVAAYVDKRGQPLATQGGIYMQLATLTEDIPAALSQTVTERLGKPVEVKLIHDGTAAALHFTPTENAAVIMLGTALGSGYPVPRLDQLLCPVSPSLIVD